MNTSKQIRRALLASLITGSVILSTGCSTPGGFSLASMNPFGKPKAETVDFSKARSDQSFASKTKSAFSKSRDSIAGVFTRNDKAESDEVKSDVDPLRLDSKTDIGPEVYVANGRLLESTGNPQKAMESYARALEAEANNPEALAAIARLHFKQENHAKASEFFQQAIKQKSNDAGLYNDLGLTLNKMGNSNAATMALERALELSPGTSRYANNLASVHFDSGNSNSAFKVLSENNEAAVAHFNMAFLHQKKGDMTSARKHLSEALKYEREAATNSSIARAVKHSRDMLAKLGNPANPANPASPIGTAIVSADTTARKAAMEIKQASQQIAANATTPVKPASMRQPTASQKKAIAAQFATARLGSKTPVKKTEKKPTADTQSESTASPSAAGPFTLPKSFTMPK